MKSRRGGHVTRMDFRLGGLLAVAVLTTFEGHDCASWSSSLKDGQVKYACAGKTLTIPWQLNLTSAETISDMEWYFRGQSEELVAILSHGHFMPMPAFAQRVRQVGNAGIEVSQVTLGDTGNYSVEVSVQETSGYLIRVRQTVYVHVADDFDGSLQVSLLSQPMFDSSTQQFALVLACGNFTYVGHPPFDVQWTDPKGNTLPSSNYSEGFFQLHLSTPVTGGTYSCQISSSAAEAACLPAATNVSVNVDETSARLSLLEAGQAATKDVDVHQKALLAQQSQRIQELENQTENLTQQLHDMASKQVSFLATPHGNLSPRSGSVVIFEHVVNNLGSAYDPSTGYFTSPHNGTYFFAITTRCDTHNTSYGDAEIKSDEHPVCRIDSFLHAEVGSCQGVAHLDRGQRVWITPVGLSDCYSVYGSFFTGFLINLDF